MQENKGQKQAIEHKDGPMLVLAGPGSGKTTVITQRTKRLIEECGVKPERILVITFTKAAAQEMKERFEKLMGGIRANVNFGTFHAVYFKILKYAYNYDASCIIREEERYQFFRDLIGKLELDIEDEKDFIEGIGSEISLVKGERVDLEHYYSMNCSEENFKKIFRAYEQMLRSTNKIDFDDMLLLCYELLVARQDILQLWQQRYEYILIDEFQDINRVQYDIIRLLAKPQDNLFIVGDDDQSIYRFRGAKPEIMLNFEKDYPDCKRVLLDINYRSQANIVEAAGRLVSHNAKRFPKDIRTVHEAGERVITREYQDVKAQNEALVRELLEYRNAGGAYRDIAILYRTNTQPGALVEKLMEYNIPFKMRDALPNIYEHWIARNLIAYIKLALGNTERALYLQIMNRPKRYLSRDAFDSAEVDLEKIKAYYWREGKGYVVEKIDKLVYDLKLLRKTNPYAAINYIRRVIGYDDYLREYAQFRRINEEELFDMLAQLQEAAREYPDFGSWFAHMEEYKEELKRQSEQKNQPDRDAVVLMTFHAAKGLEFERVYIVDANEGITPHHKAVVPEDMEEERRMFYVAVTRAKQQLIVSYTKERYNKKQEVSRFVPELVTNPEAFVEGAIVRHRVYGIGTILQCREGKISIQFERENRIRTMDLSFCIQNHILEEAKS
ncbi:MAG: ATP-dependent helicase [Lachnospiraceae bacterium]|nr:ATP-dependent helicase [Lachnospiraceae bacterium]